MLTVNNAKTIKGETLGYKTAILYLAPHTLGGKNVCQNAIKADCANTCLFHAGRGRFEEIQNARLEKTRLFWNNRNYFMSEIVLDVLHLINLCEKTNMIPLVRLNGTSDIRFENIPVKLMQHEYENIFSMFPEVQFYDYTKIADRIGNMPSNYDLTFSYSAAPAYQSEVEKALAKGARMSVVFSSKEFPKTFLGKPVINGDENDLRHLMPHNVIVGLKYKGFIKREDTPSIITV